MPLSAPKSCIHPGCNVLVRGGARCEAHRVQAGSWADRRRGSRHERGYGTEWDKLRQVILRRDAGLCQPCLRLGRTTLGSTVDHVVPKARGGTDAEANLQCICNDCHRAKTQAEANGAGR